MRHLVLSSCFWALAFTSQVSAQTTATIRAALLPLLTAAQQSITANQMPTALSKLSEARSITALNPQELVLIQRLIVAATVNDDAQQQLASATLETLIGSALVPTEERLSFIETLISLSQRHRNYPRVIQAAQQYSQLAPAKRSVMVAVAQAHYFLKQFDQAVMQIKSIVQLYKPGDTAPEETLLRMWADSYKQLKNSVGYETALWQLLTHHPKAAYFADFLNRKLEDLEPKSRYELDVYRLMRETKALTDAEDYLSMIQLCIKAGLPQEALDVLNTGKTAGKIGAGTTAAQTNALQAQINLRLTEDATSLSKLEKDAATSADGNSSALAGEIYFASGQWDKAAGFYEKAISKGGLRREEMIRLHHGIALKQSGKLALAKATLDWVSFDDTAKMIGQTWLLINNKP